MSKIKIKADSFSEIWNRRKHKLLVLVLEARDIAKSPTDAYYTLTLGSQTYKSVTLKKATDPKWNEVIFLQGNEGMDNAEMAGLSIELYSHNSLLSDDFLGEVKYNMNTIPLDEVFDTRLELKPRGDKKGKVTGHFHVRFYHSIQEDVRPKALITDMVYYYKGLENDFKTGDLILYTGIGVPPALTQIAANSSYTSVGLVIKLPNKWTQKEELYVLEVTRNVDHFNDAFEEEDRKGIMLFKLIERFHQYHGKTIWKCTLKQPLSQDNIDRMVKKMWEFHGQNDIVSFAKDPTAAYETFSFDKFLLDNFDFGKNRKNAFEWHELVGPYVIAQILLEADINITPIDKLVPHHLVTSLFYDPKLTLLRCGKTEMESHTAEVNSQSAVFMLTGHVFGFPEPKVEVPKLINPNAPQPQPQHPPAMVVHPLGAGLDPNHMMRDSKGNIFIFQQH